MEASAVFGHKGAFKRRAHKAAHSFDLVVQWIIGDFVLMTEKT